MSYTGGKHDEEAQHCSCWSCDNARKVKATIERRAEERRRALETCADLVVAYTKDGDKYGMEHGGHVIEGTLRQLLLDTAAHERPIVDIFLTLPLLERSLLLEKARRSKRVRVGDINFEEEAEAQGRRR